MVEIADRARAFLHVSRARITVRSQLRENSYMFNTFQHGSYRMFCTCRGRDHFRTWSVAHAQQRERSGRWLLQTLAATMTDEYPRCDANILR